MDGPIQRAVRSVQLAVMATPTRSFVDALAAARRAARPTLPISPADGASIAAVAAA